jgi:hypothetical protein
MPFRHMDVKAKKPGGSSGSQPRFRFFECWRSNSDWIDAYVGAFVRQNQIAAKHIYFDLL